MKEGVGIVEVDEHDGDDVFAMTGSMTGLYKHRDHKLSLSSHGRIHTQHENASLSFSFLFLSVAGRRLIF